MPAPPLTRVSVARPVNRSSSSESASPRRARSLRSLADREAERRREVTGTLAGHGPGSTPTNDNAVIRPLSAPESEFGRRPGGPGDVSTRVDTLERVGGPAHVAALLSRWGPPAWHAAPASPERRRQALRVPGRSPSRRRSASTFSLGTSPSLGVGRVSDRADAVEFEFDQVHDKVRAPRKHGFRPLTPPCGAARPCLWPPAPPPLLAALLGLGPPGLLVLGSSTWLGRHA
jgi:hypothetical protein